MDKFIAAIELDISSLKPSDHVLEECIRISIADGIARHFGVELPTVGFILKKLEVKENKPQASHSIESVKEQIIEINKVEHGLLLTREECKLLYGWLKNEFVPHNDNYMKYQGIVRRIERVAHDS